MKVLLLSAYDVASHRYWRKGLVRYLDSIDWHLLCLPARHFNWRIRGNPLSWALSEQEVLSQHYDAIVATSMVDLTTLKGLVPTLANTPSIVYFHENQFAYPPSPHQQQRIEPQMVTLYSGLAAKQLVFNSAYNRTTYLIGIEKLLRKMPDHVPKGIADQLSSKSQVIPVPIELSRSTKPTTFSTPLTLVWNHRWEYDKGPERLYSALSLLKSRDVDFRIHIIGQQFRQSPEIFEQLQNNFSEHIGEFGYVEVHKKYLRILSESDLVISTAIHEFQGLAVMEAVASGCIPVVPDRLSYPEFFDSQYCYPSQLDNIDSEATGLCDKIEYWLNRLLIEQQIEAPNVSAISWESLIDQYRDILTLTVTNSASK
jgi:glycosyltransferase involved in cell wall biosynthesis